MKVLLRNSLLVSKKLPASSSNYFSHIVSERNKDGWWETADPSKDVCVFDTSNPKSSRLFNLLADEYNWGKYSQSINNLKKDIDKVDLDLPLGKDYLEQMLSTYLSGGDRENGKVYDIYVVH